MNYNVTTLSGTKQIIADGFEVIGSDSVLFYRIISIPKRNREALTKENIYFTSSVVEISEIP